MTPGGGGGGVPLMWLHVLDRWGEIFSYSWGSAILSFLYRTLYWCSETTRFEDDQTRPRFDGCAILLQLLSMGEDPNSETERDYRSTFSCCYFSSSLQVNT
ncbi:hypothetical protein Droror1_Dr00012390 [Drosera rotundifolia]